MAIKQQKSSFADAHLIQLKNKTDSEGIFELIEDLRQQLSFQKLQRKKRGKHTAFATKVVLLNLVHHSKANRIANHKVNLCQGC